MVIRRKTRSLSLKTPLGICLLAGASSAAIVAVVILFSTPSVEADARLSRPLSTAPPGVPASSLVLSRTPAQLAPAKPAVEARTDLLKGIASWYGLVRNGHRTASGERFNMNAMTAAHRTLPFGSLVRVIDQNTGRSVVVRINDRGILSEGRIIDLSYGAAEALNITRAGLAQVQLEVVSLGKSRQKKQAIAQNEMAGPGLPQ
jgi:rare lipoprotein A